MKLLLQCLEQRVQLQRAAAGRLKLAEGARARRVLGEVTVVKMRMAALERGQLQRRDAGVIHQFRLAQALEPGAELGRARQRCRFVAFAEVLDRFDVEVEHVEKAAR